MGAFLLKNMKFYQDVAHESHYKWLEAIQTFSQKEADILLLTGGADVNPDLYGQKKHPKTFCHLHRDQQCNAIFKNRKPHQLLLGICRGAQYLTVKAGGKLIQHVNNHTSNSHAINTNDGLFKIGGDHHQMMDPRDTDHVLLGWSDKNYSTIYEDGDENPVKLPENWREPEIVYYPKIHALAIQGHPEWTVTEKFTITYLNALIDVYKNKYKKKSMVNV